MLSIDRMAEGNYVSGYLPKLPSHATSISQLCIGPYHAIALFDVHGCIISGYAGMTFASEWPYWQSGAEDGWAASQQNTAKLNIYKGELHFVCLFSLMHNV